MNKYRFEEVFSLLGESWDLPDELFSQLEEFVCRMYGHCQREVDNLRWKLFQKKYTLQAKSIDLAALPPCRQVLRLHCERANYVARLWKLSLISNEDIPSFIGNGWNDCGEIQLIEQAFPDDMDDIFFDPLFEENGEETTNYDTESEDDDNEH